MTQPRQDDPQLKLRLPRAVKIAIAASAASNNRSVNAEIVARLEASLSNSPDIAAIVKAAVKEALAETTSKDTSHLTEAAEEPGWRNIPLELCEIYMRVFNILNLRGYRTLGQVADATDEELLEIPHFGRSSLEHVRKVIADERKQMGVGEQ